VIASQGLPGIKGRLHYLLNIRSMSLLQNSLFAGGSDESDIFADSGNEIIL
jgi:hypothetical protein